MRENYLDLKNKIYYFSMLVPIAMMIMGLFVDNPHMGDHGVGFIWHVSLVVILSGCLLLYPRYVNRVFRMILMIVASVYFYTIFFLYPDTGSTFIFLCFIPTISILFFDAKLFYFSLALNSVSIIFTYSYIVLFGQGYQFYFIKQDLIGNIINFIGSQVIIYFIFYLTYGRIKKQQQYYEQLKQTERLKITGQLAAAVAHEIRNPLTVVKGFLELYEKDPAVSNDIKRHYRLMISELNTAEHVISQLLSVAKPNNDLDIETVNVNDVLQSATDLLHSYGLLHENKIELNMAEECFIAANTIEIKQLLINIIKNAIEASEIGDSVKITAEMKNDLVEIKVIDYGQGMSEVEVESLGTPFYSLKSKGTGLGMMICYNIAKKYKGTIDVQSTKGEGTTVTIRFPSENNL
ncbi:ATP-binding protein [Lederbergia wuyishanensis]|uniref:histidine kinase n=1 Tax=Lederbergia wuyishanensis TaxID=1347903 RepID=A0ABU0D2N8_9BACI|nr:HAMP domain-containing sensor histidine kinase [Lederbergia wuyishanensis]MCJ8007191.1 HAMP domain-containing histidine kinase [Lederbergia wuyishanensis]MDQ0342664.1 two-component system sporulation sensor kinase B [Lederbergia wuyishanensis]